MEFMPVFGLVGSLVSSLAGGDDDPDPAPQRVIEERPKAPKVDDAPQTAGMKERVAVRNAREKRGISGSSLSTRSGVAIVGGA